MDVPPLTEDDVHIWYVFSDAVRDPHLLAHYSALMTPEERARHDRFVFAKDRHQFLVTRGVVRTLVGRYLDIDPALCAFDANPYGRPFLREPAGGLSFNLSHTHGLVACALARVPEIGVDVEDLERTPATLELARRFFSPAEAAALESVPLANRQSRFFDYWTLKEAYIKARGMGLSLPLDGFSMELEAGGPPRIRCGPSVDTGPERWQFAQFDPSPRHRLAVAVRRGTRELHIHFRELAPSAP